SILDMFVPGWRAVDQSKDKSLHDLASIIAETMSIHAAATELLEHERWDLAAIYYCGIDHFSHRFMRYHAGKPMPRGQDDSDPAPLPPAVCGTPPPPPCFGCSAAASPPRGAPAP